MKERRKGLLWEMALILLTVAACLYSTGAGNIFGAKVDWSSQHSVPGIFPTAVLSYRAVFS